MKRYVPLYTLLLLAFSIQSCNGQQKTEVKKERTSSSTEVIESKTDPYFINRNGIESSEGPKHITRNVLQDQNGVLWFATWEGIIRYDASTFTNITNKEGLDKVRVFSLLEDSKGNIWFGTIGSGVYQYDGEKFRNFTTDDGLIDNAIGCMMEDSKGKIWFGTMKGISTYDGTMFQNVKVEGDEYNNDINAIVEDNSGTYWIGSRGYALTYDGKNFSKITKPDGRGFGNVRTIIKDKEGNMWLGGNDGFWSYANSTFTNYNKHFTGYIYQDSKETIWTSALNTTSNNNHWALTRYDKIAQLNKGQTAQQILSEENMFFGITEDQKGNIWLGHLRGVYRYDGLLFDSFTEATNN